MTKKPSISKVFFLPWEARNRLTELLQQSGAENTVQRGDLTALKMHFGEQGTEGYIRPEYLRPIIQMVHNQKGKPFLTDTGTIYLGHRTHAVEHLELALQHGFSQNRLQVPIIIADGLRGCDFREVKIDGTYFKKVNIASAIYEASSMLVLSHFKGHVLAGFGGAIKNLGMGCSARKDKFAMHSNVAPELTPKLCTTCGECIKHCAQKALSFVDRKIHLDKEKCAGCGECIIVCKYRVFAISWNEGSKSVQERFVEYALGAIKEKRTFYLNFLNFITPDCDCINQGEKPIIPDIGIMASSDPVAIDQASLDIVIEKAGDIFKKAHPHTDGNVQLEYAEKLGLGSRKYKLLGL